MTRLWIRRWGCRHDAASFHALPPEAQHAWMAWFDQEGHGELARDSTWFALGEGIVQMEVIERPTRLIRDPACPSPALPGHVGCDCRVATYEVELPVKTLPPAEALGFDGTIDA